MKDRHDRLSQAKAHKLALDESRQNFETLIENAYHASGNADDISSVESMIAEVGSSVSQMSERLKSLADSDNDLAKADDSLINEQAPHIIRSLRTWICYLQRREDIATLRNEKKAAKSQVASGSRESIPDPSKAAKAQVASAPRESIPDASEASAVLISNKSVAAESMLTQGVDKQVPNPYALNPNATAFTPSVCKNV